MPPHDSPEPRPPLARVAEAARRLGLNVTTSDLRTMRGEPPRSFHTGYAADLRDPDEPLGSWQVLSTRRPDLLFDPAANLKAGLRYMRERYGATSVYGFPTITDTEQPEDTITMAPPNPYRDRRLNTDMAAYDDSGSGGLLDLDAVNLLLTHRYRQGRAAGLEEGNESLRRGLENAHDEGYELGTKLERQRLLQVVDARLRAAALLVEKITAGPYGEDDVARVFAVIGATCKQLLDEVHGGDAVREDLRFPEGPLPAALAHISHERDPDAAHLQRLEQYLRDRLPRDEEPIADPPAVPIEVQVHAGMTAERIGREVRDALERAAGTEA